MDWKINFICYFVHSDRYKYGKFISARKGGKSFLLVQRPKWIRSFIDTNFKRKFLHIFFICLFELVDSFIAVIQRKTASVVQWSEFLATDLDVRVLFPALQDFLKNSGSGMGSTQPRDYN
jgi:hypothetical protein